MVLLVIPDCESYHYRSRVVSCTPPRHFWRISTSGHPGARELLIWPPHFNEDSCGDLTIRQSHLEVVS
jgi:hypothetical protein